MEKTNNQKGREKTTASPTKNLIRRQFNNEYKGSDGIINHLPSETVPDQSLTILQLLTNHSRGIHSDVSERQGEYFEEIEVPQFTDLNDIAEHREKLNQKRRETNERIKADLTAKKQKDEETPPTPPKPSAKPPQNPPNEEESEA